MAMSAENRSKFAALPGNGEVSMSEKFSSEDTPPPPTKQTKQAKIHSFGFLNLCIKCEAVFKLKHHVYYKPHASFLL